MSEWWTYSPENFLMFSARTYYRLIERHNAALWPAHLVALLVGGVLLGLLWFRPEPRSARLAAVGLSGGWLLVAAAYFWTRYATIHTGGRWFAAAFAGQAAVLLWVGAVRGRWTVPRPADWRAKAGLVWFGLAVLAYPGSAWVADRPWTQAECFGLAPDPTVLGTLGLLLLFRSAWWLWVVPVGWGLFSAMTLWTLHAPEAGVMLGLTVGGVVIALWPRRNG